MYYDAHVQQASYTAHPMAPQQTRRTGGARIKRRGRHQPGGGGGGVGGGSTEKAPADVPVHIATREHVGRLSVFVT